MGLFIIAGLVLFVVFIYSIGERQNLFRSSFELSAVFKNVNGLQKGNNVRYSGINIGTVQSIEFESDSLLRVNMSLTDKVRGIIRKNAIASIGSDGLVGNMLVNITPGDGISSPADDGVELASFSRIETEELLSTLGTTNDNIALISNDLLKITQAIVKGEGVISELLYNANLAQQLQKTMKYLSSASQQLAVTTLELKGLASDIRSSEGLLNTALNDTIVMHNLRNFSTELESIPLASIDTFMLQLNQAGSYVNILLDELLLLISEVRDGDGLIGTALSDSLARDDLIEILENVKEGTGKFNVNMEALKSNFLFRRYFKKQAKKERKDSVRQAGR